MYLETVKVSRKTPGDGKLQVTATTFRSLEGAGSRLTARLRDRDAACGLVTMECTCVKGATVVGRALADQQTAPEPHRHFFLQSTLFSELAPDGSVRLDLDGVLLRVTVTPL
jgi:hypothetical protein